VVKFGVEVFFESGEFKRFKGKRLALLCNQASVDENFRYSFVRFKEVFGKDFKLIFSPQHGLFSEKQANMIPSADEIEPFTQTPVVSLYGPRLSPEKKHLSEVDVVFVDLQDVGCRVYTYVWTLFLLMRECEKLGKTVVVLDRPNPCGAEVSGPVLKPDYFSFVGMAEIPLQHGLTIGELAKFFVLYEFPNLELEVVKMQNYSPNSTWKDTKRAWVFTSPNIPTWETCLVYPGMVLFEGTNVSEGRGTSLPFFLFGAPYVDWKPLQEPLKRLLKEFPEIYLRPVCFEPVFDKWKQEKCKGFQIHLLSSPKRITIFAIKLLKILASTFEEFEFLPPPYEFEKEKKPIEILIGDQKVLNWIFGKEEFDLEEYVYYNLGNYEEKVKACRLYA